MAHIYIFCYKIKNNIGVFNTNTLKSTEKLHYETLNKSQINPYAITVQQYFNSHGRLAIAKTLYPIPCFLLVLR